MTADFGRYRLVRPLGAGGMAEVALAHQLGPSGFVKPCVLKRIATDHAKNERYRRLFLDEARVSALLNHPHIVQTYDFGEIDGTPYLALELVDGTNLSELCRELSERGHWIPVRASLEVVAQVASALAYAHDLVGLDGRPLELVHRDVSPANILVSRQGVAKLADFGIARHQAREEVTMGPSVKGKLGYMAPEQALADVVDRRADLFSLGIVLVELLSARRVMKPGIARSLADLPKRIAELLALRTELPLGLVSFATAMTAIDPGERPASGAIVAETLTEIAGGLPATDGLAPFLRQAFAMLPSSGPARPATEVRSLAAVSPTAGALAVGTAEDPARSGPTEIAALPSPPDTSIEELSFVKDDWVKKEPADSPAELLYGWPAELVDDAPRPALALKPRPEAPEVEHERPPPQHPEPPPQGPPGAPHSAAARGPTPAPRSATPAPLPAGLGLPPAPPAPEPERLVVDWAKVKKPSPTEPVDPLDERFRAMAPYVLRGAAAVIAVGLVVVLVSLFRGPSGPPPPTHGRVTVASDRPGAEILLDGRPTGLRTPGELPTLPLATAAVISVRLAGHLPEPREVRLTLTEEEPFRALRFHFVRARTLTIASDPAGADVELNGKAVRGETPLQLPPLPLGSTATLTVRALDSLPKSFALKVTTETPTVTKVTLEGSRELDIASDPIGATVYLEGERIGETPLGSALVPRGRPFKLRFEKRGFRRLEQKVSPKLAGAGKIRVELKALPLIEMPMSSAERARLRELESKIGRLRLDLLGDRAAQKKAEAALDAFQARGGSDVLRMTQLQNRADELRAKVESAEVALDDLVGQLEEHKNMILGRVVEEE